MSKMYYLIVVLNVLLLIGLLNGQLNTNNDSNGSIGFPESEEDPYRKNKDNRQPVYLPSTCGLNELYYPGDQADDWICDCRPAHLFHPDTDTCWPAFQQGPCVQGQHLVLPKDTVIPNCVKNPCNNTQVLFNGKCERLGSVAVCSYLYPVAAAVGVNAVTLEVGCERLNLETRFGETRIDPSCKRGSRRYTSGKCYNIKK